jgi:hypothetical protein
MSRGALALTVLFTLGAAAQQPAPQIQNGRVETRQTTAIDREVAALTNIAGDGLWVGWRVPIADGQRGGCCTYNDDVRGCFVENDGSISSVRAGTPATTTPAAVSLDAGTGLVILARLTDRGLERLRTLGDDCPLDAAGKTVYWLQGVTPAESLKYLDGLIQLAPFSSGIASEGLRDTALSAVARHRDAGADAIIDRLATNDIDSPLRRSARRLLGSSRGAHGYATLARLLEQEKLPEIRRQLVVAIGASRQPQAVDVLLRLAKTDWDAKVRGEAVYHLPPLGGPRVIPDVNAIIASDAVDTVKQRAVQGLGRLAAPETVPLLIQLAGSTNAVVKKEAVTALSRSKDPKAVAYMEELIRRM